MSPSICCADDHGVYLVRSNQCPSTYLPGTDGQEVCSAPLQPQQYSLLYCICHRLTLQWGPISMSVAAVDGVAPSGNHAYAAMQQRDTAINRREKSSCAHPQPACVLPTLLLQHFVLRAHC